MVNSDAALTHTLPVTWYSVNMKVRTKTTDSSGHFALKLDLQPRDEKPTTYTITASFGGEEGQIKTAYATAPDGTQYPICTTIQHDYLPASTTATLTVEPPTTTVSADPETTATEQPESSTVEVPPTKTPEEMQEEAEDEGWLEIKHKFS